MPLSILFSGTGTHAGTNATSHWPLNRGETEPKQIGEGTQVSTEPQASPET